MRRCREVLLLLGACRSCNCLRDGRDGQTGRRLEHRPTFEGECLLRIDFGPLALVVAFVTEGIDLGLDAVLHRHDRRDARFGRVLARHEESRDRESLHLSAGEVQVADLAETIDTGHFGVLVVRHRQELPLLPVAVRFAHPREVRGADGDHSHTVTLGDEHGCHLLRCRLLILDDLGVATLAIRRRPREVDNVEAEAELVREDIGRVEAAAPGVHGATLQAVKALEDRRRAAHATHADPRHVHAAFLDLAVEGDDLEVLVVETGHHLHALQPARIAVTHVEHEVVLEETRAGQGRLRFPDVVVVVDGATRFDDAGRVLDLADVDEILSHRVVGTRRRTGRDDHRFRHAFAEGSRGEEGSGDGDGGELETHGLVLLCSLERVGGLGGLGCRLVAARERSDRDECRDQDEDDGDGSPEALAEPRGFDRRDAVLRIS